ncbi:MAG: chemotaxis protein CheW [Desulfuromonas thiophila]|jgi:chemotaxis protein histidine kinase CheA|nr:chemotaxis protein CheW [Desulfuromonas thiophila]MDY0398116.1 chemotaxis protein CheW [Desulfuromonas thiophila]
MTNLQESLMPLFLTEAESGLGQLRALRAAIEQQLVTADLLDDARRAAHTIKGTAALVKRQQASELGRTLELLLEEWIAQGRLLSQADADQLENHCRALQNCLTVTTRPAAGVSTDAVADRFGTTERTSAEALGGDLIRDFALPFMMKLHQNAAVADELVRPASCCFYLRQQTYVLPIDQVAEIVQAASVTPLPFAPPAVLGLLNLRGEVVPVVSPMAETNRRVKLMADFFVVVAFHGADRIAFVSDRIPQLSLVEEQGQVLDVAAFIELQRAGM